MPRATFRRPFHEHLLVEVVKVSLDEDVNIAHDLQDVQALIQSSNGKVVFIQIQSVHLLCQVRHFTVSFPVVKCDRGQVVESPIKVVLHLALQ